MGGVRNKTGFGTFDLAVFGAFMLNALVFLWAYRFVPLQDYPDWVYQGFLFYKALQGQLMKSFYLINYPVPNAVSTVLMGALNFVFMPETSGKIVFSADLVLFAAGSVYLLSASDTRRNSALYYIPLLLLFNFFFFLGYVNYYFSLGILFFGLGYIIRRQNDLRQVRLPVLTLFSLLLFFSHAMSYGIFMLYLALLLLSNRNMAALRKSFLAVLPSIILVLFYTVNHLRSPKLGLPLAANVQRFRLPIFEEAIQYFSVYHRFYPFAGITGKGSALFNTLNHVFCYLIVALLAYGCYYALRNFKQHRVLSAMISLSTALFIFSPLYFVGIVKPGERFLFPALWLTMECLIPSFNGVSAKVNSAAKVLLLAFFAVQIGFLYGHAGLVARRSAAVYADLVNNTKPGELGLIYESHFDYEDEYENTFFAPRTFLPQYAPIMRLPYYFYTERYLYTPIFLTGIIGNRKPVPANDSVSTIGRMIDYYPDQIAIMGDEQGNEYIFSLLQPKYRLRFRNDYMLIVERVQQPRT